MSPCLSLRDTPSLYLLSRDLSSLTFPFVNPYNYSTISEPFFKFKSNVRETWRVILVSEADMFLSESLRILAERLSQSEIGLPLRQICYYSPAEEVGVFSTEIKNDTKIPVIYINTYNRDFFHCFLVKSVNLHSRP